MSIEHSLANVLEAYRNSATFDESQRILSATTTVLASLSNPRNVSLLTSQLLAAPAIWSLQADLRTSSAILDVFRTSGRTIQWREHTSHGQSSSAMLLSGSTDLGYDEWSRAVNIGIDGRSKLWQHVLVFSGMLLSLQDTLNTKSRIAQRARIEHSLVAATNAFVEHLDAETDFAIASVVLAIAHTLGVLSPAALQSLNHNALAHIIIDQVATTHGYEGGTFLRSIGKDDELNLGHASWPSKSTSHLQAIMSKPLIATIGPISACLTHCIQRMSDLNEILHITERLHHLSKNILDDWRLVALSELGHAGELSNLNSLPILWQVLKGFLFSTVTILQSIISRALLDSNMHKNTILHVAVRQCLQILRNVHFIVVRFGSTSFSAHNFVYLATLDMISQSNEDCMEFLRSNYPRHAGSAATHPVDQDLDLFYLNACEHLAASLPPQAATDLVAKVARPYLEPLPGKSGNNDIYEAAHTAYLAVLCAPLAFRAMGTLLPEYVDLLFAAFPLCLSSRQFTYAFQTLVKVTCSPSPDASLQFHRAEALLEMLHHAVLHASPAPVPFSASELGVSQGAPTLSLQCQYYLTMCACLPLLYPSLLVDWLDIAAGSLQAIADPVLRNHCANELWALLNRGEMDSERAIICVDWWSKRGRAQVFGTSSGNPGPNPARAVM